MVILSYYAKLWLVVFKPVENLKSSKIVKNLQKAITFFRLDVFASQIITNLKNYCVFRILKFSVLKVPAIQIPTQNEKMKDLFSEFHQRTDLTALLLIDSGFRIKTTCSKFLNLQILRDFTYKFRTF
jgi:intergrase/recombinase